MYTTSFVLTRFFSSSGLIQFELSEDQRSEILLKARVTEPWIEGPGLNSVEGQKSLSWT